MLLVVSLSFFPNVNSARATDTEVSDGLPPVVAGGPAIVLRSGRNTVTADRISAAQSRLPGRVSTRAVVGLPNQSPIIE